MTNAQSRLIINPEYDFKELEMNMLRSFIFEICLWFEHLDIETRGANTKLIPELLETIEDFSKKEEIYTPKQMEKFQSDYHKRTAKQLYKLLSHSEKKARNQTGIN
jgi:DNA polymerase II large subunit